MAIVSVMNKSNWGVSLYINDDLSPYCHFAFFKIKFNQFPLIFIEAPFNLVRFTPCSYVMSYWHNMIIVNQVGLWLDLPNFTTSCLANTTLWIGAKILLRETMDKWGLFQKSRKITFFSLSHGKIPWIMYVHVAS